MNFFRISIFLLIALPGAAWAQTASTIEGIVLDAQGLPILNALVEVENHAFAISRTVATDVSGFYRVPALPAGYYDLGFSAPGMARRRVEKAEVLLNTVIRIDMRLEVSAVTETVSVTAAANSPDITTAAAAETVTPQEIADFPVAGRDFLNLMQLVPGVVINPGVSNQYGATGGDTETPVLGERAGNAFFLIDGLPDRSEVNGGPASKLNQESIAAFQVMTNGYKAEFGRGSGGVINVITKTGSNNWHGSASAYHRNSALDGSNIGGNPPFLLRWDYGLTAGGPLRPDRVFFFGSAERIHENRHLNFKFDPGTLLFPSLVRSEQGYDNNSFDNETRAFARLDEQHGRHMVTETFSLSNAHVTDFLPLSQQGVSLPSTRRNNDGRDLLAGVRDTILLGSGRDPLILSGSFRSDPAAIRPAHPEAGPGTTLIGFSTLTSGQLFGDLSFVQFGSTINPLKTKENTGSASATISLRRGRHEWKFGSDVIHTRFTGTEAAAGFNLLFTTVQDFEHYGPMEAGLYSTRTLAAPSSDLAAIRVSDTSLGMFLQDDWSIRDGLTANLGVRWDRASLFPGNRNISPRLGLVWKAGSATVLRASWGLFYDHIRNGVARDVPALGGADIQSQWTISYPRLLYGIPTSFPLAVGNCLSPVLTDAQIASSGAQCPYFPAPLIGVDRLNAVVAAGHPAIPANEVVTIQNVQSLSGLSPSAFVNQASSAIRRPAGTFFWDESGHLSQYYVPPSPLPITVDAGYRAPYSRTFQFGVEQQLTGGIKASATYHQKAIENILGLRETNIAFQSRIPGNGLQLVSGTGPYVITSFGPWYDGSYKSLDLHFETRFKGGVLLSGNYQFTHAFDDIYNSNLISELPQGSVNYFPSDNFVGIVPLVTDPISGNNNATAGFTSANGSPVPQAGKFYNGPQRDRGPSDMALNHVFTLYGTVKLPKGFQSNAIFRAQSGFHYSRLQTLPVDDDGDGLYTSIDHAAGRNAFTADPFVNMDVRVSRQFSLGEKARAEILFEFFNLFNRHNPAAVSETEGAPTPFGRPLQVLPGREGQFGLRFQF